MRPHAITPGHFAALTTEGIAEFRELLSPEECRSLSPPENVQWSIETSLNDPNRTWAYTTHYRLGSSAVRQHTALRKFMNNFRELVHTNAEEAGYPELTEWGDTTRLSAYPVELLHLPRTFYSARWHRTPANHEIGWHSDNTFGQQIPSGGVIRARALGFMVAINLTEHGGSYEYAPRDTEVDPGTRKPLDITAIKRIGDIGIGDAVAFCTAINTAGDTWPGSFPWHRFVSADYDSQIDTTLPSRDSLTLFYQDLSSRRISDIGLKRVLKHVVISK